ncbi:hypothetical protein YPPY66_0686, partial [Yersinia pestis PY-66]
MTRPIHANNKLT